LGFCGQLFKKIEGRFFAISPVPVAAVNDKTPKRQDVRRHARDPHRRPGGPPGRPGGLQARQEGQGQGRRGGQA